MPYSIWSLQWLSIWLGTPSWTKTARLWAWKTHLRRIVRSVHRRTGGKDFSWFSWEELGMYSSVCYLMPTFPPVLANPLSSLKRSSGLPPRLCPGHLVPASGFQHRLSGLHARSLASSASAHSLVFCGRSFLLRTRTGLPGMLRFSNAQEDLLHSSTSDSQGPL